MVGKVMHLDVPSMNSELLKDPNETHSCVNCVRHSGYMNYCQPCLDTQLMSRPTLPHKRARRANDIYISDVLCLHIYKWKAGEAEKPKGPCSTHFAYPTIKDKGCVSRLRKIWGRIRYSIRFTCRTNIAPDEYRGPVVYKGVAEIFAAASHG